MSKLKKIGKKQIYFFLCLLAAVQLFGQAWVDKDPVEDVWDDDFIAQNALDDYSSNSEEFEDDLVDAEKYVITIIESAQKHDLNPHTSAFASDAQILSGIFEGLFSYNPESLEPVPALCTGYKISRDKKRWTFTLRDNARFSDSTKITAEDVRNSWIELLSTKNASFASMLDVIVGAKEFRTGKTSSDNVAVTVLSPTQLSVRLNTPVSYLPKVLCHAAFSVTHRNPTVYSGAYSISDMNEKQIILQKNEYYWDAGNVKTEMICFFQSFDSDENAHLYNTGYADWITSYDVNTSKILNKNAIQINAQFGTEYLFFKSSSKKPKSLPEIRKVWDDPDFRLAVLEAMPWDVLRAGSLVPATTFVYPLSDYPRVDGYSYTDANEALLLMNDAREKAGISKSTRIPLVMLLSEGTLDNDKVSAMKDALEPLGVDLSVKFSPFMEYFNSVETCDADIVAYNWIGDFADPLAFLELFRGDSTLNVSGWRNDDFDALIEKSSGIQGKERYEFLAEAERILMDAGIILPLSHSVSLSIVNRNAIGGWYENAFNIHPLKYIYKKDYAPKIPNVI